MITKLLEEINGRLETLNRLLQDEGYLSKLEKQIDYVKEENRTLKRNTITLSREKSKIEKEKDDYLNRIKEATKLIKKQKVYLNDSINLHKKDLMNILKGKKEVNKK